MCGCKMKRWVYFFLYHLKRLRKRKYSYHLRKYVGLTGKASAEPWLLLLIALRGLNSASGMGSIEMWDPHSSAWLVQGSNSSFKLGQEQTVWKGIEQLLRGRSEKEQEMLDWIRSLKERLKAEFQAEKRKGLALEIPQVSSVPECWLWWELP